MALPTVVNQGLIDILNAAPEHKAAQLVGKLQQIKDLCIYIIGESPMRARRLVDIQNSLYMHKELIQSQSLTNLASRTVIATAYPQYADAAAVLVDVQSANTAFNQLTQEIETVLAQVRLSGQILDNDPVTGQVIEPVISDVDMTTLRSFAASVQALLG